MRPTLKALQAEIAELNAKVLEADQCAARALEGRDMLARECLALEAAAKQAPMFVPDARYAPLLKECARLKLELQIARCEVRLMRLKARGRNG